MGSQGVELPSRGGSSEIPAFLWVFLVVSGGGMVLDGPWMVVVVVVVPMVPFVDWLKCLGVGASCYLSPHPIITSSHHPYPLASPCPLADQCDSSSCPSPHWPKCFEDSSVFYDEVKCRTLGAACLCF